MKLNIKKNDQVLVIAGDDKGTQAKVLRVLSKEGKAVVERVNMIKRHTRPNPQRQVQGGILEREAPMQIANLMLICPDCGKPTRVGRKRLEDGTGARLCKRCGATIR
jgi:large subunit ribosomal protein L24